MIRNWRLPDSGFPGQFMEPKPFFIGVVAGFLICCGLGLISSHNQNLEGFKRFHFFISPYTRYYPTLGQLDSLVKPARPDQTIVVIGGNSIFNGFGQKTDDLWSEKLKQNLGDKFYVVNLAMDGTAPFESGSWVAEKLIKQKRKVIFITTAEPRRLSPPSGFIMSQNFFDFYNRKELLDCEKRDKCLAEQLDPLHTKVDRIVMEKALGKQIDRFTNSSELWHWVGQNLFFTVWCYGTHPNFMAPRRLYSDDHRQHGNLDEEVFETQKVTLASEQNSLACKTSDGTWKPIKQNWDIFDGNSLTIPSELLKRSIVFVPRHSPDLVDKFSSSQKEIYDQVLNIAVHKWKANGADSLVLGDGFESSSYCDMRHFSATGGTLVSKIVADRIREDSEKIAKCANGTQ